MDELLSTPWAWTAPIISMFQQALEVGGTIPTTTYFYFGPCEANPLMGTPAREEAEIMRLSGVDLTTEALTAASIAALQKEAFERGPDAVMMIGEAWDFSDNPEVLEQAKNGEQVQPGVVSLAIFCSVETRSSYYLSSADVLEDRKGHKTFIPRSLMEFEEVSNEDLPEAYARVLPVNQ